MMDPAIDLTRSNAPAIPLWDAGRTPLFDPSAGQREPALFPYLLKDKPGAGAIIVCPGGGYTTKAPHEGEPIALRFNELGFNAFVLDYRVAPYKHPAPLYDASRSVKVVRHMAKDLDINPQKIAILGFSAGGHLSGCAATVYDNGDPSSPDPVERHSSRPDAAVLCYAVLNFIAYQHSGSMENLLGRRAEPADRIALTPELNVNENTPPMFLWHTAQDAGVPAMNSVSLASQLIQRGIACSLHVYPFGNHGIGLGLNEPQASRWTEEAANFLKGLGF